MARAVKSVSVIVPTYNEEKNIGKCLSALNGQSLPREEFEVIVVDGGSKDGTVKIAENLGAKVMRQASKGVGGARNDGVYASAGDLIATTDADCMPPEVWLENISEAFERDSLIKALTGPLEPMITENMGLLDSYNYRMAFKLANLIRSTCYTHLCGANSAFRRDAFIEIGGYSSDELERADDVEIGRRLTGKKIFDHDVSMKYSLRRIEKVGLSGYVIYCLGNDKGYLQKYMRDKITAEWLR